MEGLLEEMDISLNLCRSRFGFREVPVPTSPALVARFRIRRYYYQGWTQGQREPGCQGPRQGRSRDEGLWFR